MSKRIRLKFGGMNNVADPIDLGRIADYKAPVIIEHISIRNLLCGDTMAIRLRPGRILIYPGDVSALWATPDESQAFIIHEGVLRRMYPDLTSEAIGLVNGPEAAFAEINSIIAFTDGQSLWSITGAGFLLANGTSADTFVRAMPAGHILALHGSRLFVATEDGFEYSMAYNAFQKDFRNCRIPLPGRPTMGISVKTGMWVSYDKGVFFWTGDDPTAFAEAPKKHASPAIKGSSFLVNGDRLKTKGVSGPTAVWVSADGIFLGTGAGEVINLSEHKIALADALSAAAAILKVGGGTYIVAVLQDLETTRNTFAETPAVIDDVTI